MKNVTEDRGIKIDTKVLEMLEKAGSNAGSFRKLAKLCGISPVSISRWQGKVANQTVECIDWPNWEKLWGYPTKHDIIDPTDIRWMPPTVLRDALASGKVKPAPGSDVEPVPGKGFQKYPVVSTAAAAGVNTAYYPLAEFAAENPEEMVAFPAGRPGDFVFRVQGDSMKPWYPPGTYLLVRPHQKPRNGDRVVAVLGDGEIVFKCFLEKKETFMLLSINDAEGQNLEFKKSDWCSVQNVYKVIQSIRVEEELDAAMTEKGTKHFWQKYVEE